jgi:hypothetical protein
MSGQNGAGQIIEAVLALLAPIALTMPLGVIMAVASYGGAVTVGAADALGPPMLAHQLVAFRVINQQREVHQGWHGHEQHRDRCKGLPSTNRFTAHHVQTSTTPESRKSLFNNPEPHFKGSEKMETVFFNISRSMRTRSSSRFRRVISADWSPIARGAAAC